VTGGDDGSGRLVIPLPWEKLEFGSEYGGPLSSPAGWPRLPPPDPGEPVAAFIDRATIEDPFLRSIMPRTSRGPVPPLAVVRPADLTLLWWGKTWPYKEFSLWEDTPPPNYHRDRVYWRLVVEWFDRLRDGDPVMRGHRTDIPHLNRSAGADPASGIRAGAAPARTPEELQLYGVTPESAVAALAERRKRLGQ
jgi:hypothetical protein